MTCRVVTIALSDGALAEQIGPRVAAALGFRYVDDEIINRAAIRAGVSTEAIGKEEHTRPLVARILAAMATMSAADPESGMIEVEAWQDPSLTYRELIRQVIHETAAEGNVVIAAHGAGINLAGAPDLLRVFVTATPDTRAQRLASLARVDAAEAKRRVEHGDHERRAYLDRFYGIRQELPTHYDLVINTDHLPATVAARVIADAAGAML